VAEEEVTAKLRAISPSTVDLASGSSGGTGEGAGRASAPVGALVLDVESDEDHGSDTRRALLSGPRPQPYLESGSVLFRRYRRLVDARPPARPMYPPGRLLHLGAPTCMRMPTPAW
jgi:hypothetical protein